MIETLVNIKIIIILTDVFILRLFNFLILILKITLILCLNEFINIKRHTFCNGCCINNCHLCDLLFAYWTHFLFEFLMIINKAIIAFYMSARNKPVNNFRHFRSFIFRANNFIKFIILLFLFR